MDIRVEKDLSEVDSGIGILKSKQSEAAYYASTKHLSMNFVPVFATYLTRRILTASARFRQA
jgi:hypothetical protein